MTASDRRDNDARICLATRQQSNRAARLGGQVCWRRSVTEAGGVVLMAMVAAVRLFHSLLYVPCIGQPPS